MLIAATVKGGTIDAKLKKWTVQLASEFATSCYKDASGKSYGVDEIG
jgi:hypothetical protein